MSNVYPLIQLRPSWSPPTRYTVLYAWLSRAMHIRLPNGRICNNKPFFPVIIRRCDLNPSIVADSKCLFTSAAYGHALALQLTKLWRHSRTPKTLSLSIPDSSGQQSGHGQKSKRPQPQLQVNAYARLDCSGSARKCPINQTMPWFPVRARQL